MLLVLLLASLLTVEKIAVERTTDLKKAGSPTDLETEPIAAVQPNGDVEHIMLTKTQYEALKAGGTIKLGRNVRLRAKAVHP